MRHSQYICLSVVTPELVPSAVRIWRMHKSETLVVLFFEERVDSVRMAMQKTCSTRLRLHRSCHAYIRPLCPPSSCPFFRFRAAGREGTRGNFSRNVWTGALTVGAARSERSLSNMTCRKRNPANVFDLERGVIFAEPR